MFGHRVQASLGMGYAKLPQPITPKAIAGMRWEIGVGDWRVAATAQLAPWHDPKSERIRV